MTGDVKAILTALVCGCILVALGVLALIGRSRDGESDWCDDES
jgi:hypothetical protein